jgi:hypothetical protein
MSTRKTDKRSLWSLHTNTTQGSLVHPIDITTRKTPLQFGWPGAQHTTAHHSTPQHTTPKYTTPTCML